MTKQIARYATLQFQPYPNRTEHLNYGVVVFLPEGGIRVHLISDMRKLKAFASMVDIDKLRTQEDFLPTLVTQDTARTALAKLNALRVLRDVNLQSLGAFAYSSSAEYSQNIQLALQAQCEVAGPFKTIREPKSRLYLDVKSKFKAIGILSSTQDVASDRRVIEHFAPDPSVDVKVEFALKNGKLRVAQTVDLRAGSSDIVSAVNRNNAFSKAYAIHFTRSSITNVESFVIAAGADTDSAQKILTPIAKDADQILHWENGSDMEGFFTDWANAAGKPIPVVHYAD